MTLFALIVALLLEQFRPLNAAKWLYPPLEALGAAIELRFNDGQRRHGMIAWLVMVLPPVFLSILIYTLLYYIAGFFAALLFNIVVLYYTMGFRHSSHFFTRIHAALREGQLPEARRLLGEWRGHLHDQSPSSEVIRLSLEGGLIGAHRQVFAIVVLFILLPGPSGAVLYRMAHYYADAWHENAGLGMRDFGHFARRAFAYIDWLPARLTALAFAIVGDFEDAIHCWRTQAQNWPVETDSVLLASGAGALGVRLGQPIHQSGDIAERPELGTGDEVEIEHLQSFIGLVRRMLVLYGLVLLMTGITRLTN